MKNEQIEKVLQRLSIRELMELLPFWNDIYLNEVGEFFEDKNNLIAYFLRHPTIIFYDQDKFSKFLTKFTDEEYKCIISDSNFKDSADNLKIMKQMRKKYNNSEKHCSVRSKLLIEKKSKPFYELLDYQYYIKSQVMNLLDFKNLNPSAVIHMPTGSGKTKTMMHTLIDFYQNNVDGSEFIVWLAHTNILLEQAEKTFVNCWEHLGKKNVNLYRLRSSVNGLDINCSGGIVFASIQSIINLEKNDTLLFEYLATNIRIICIDEAHKATATKTKLILNKLMKYEVGKNKALLGLTATPGRSMFDFKENEVLIEFFEDRIIKIDVDKIESFRKSKYQMLFQNDMEVIHYLQNRHIMAKLVREELRYNIDETNKNIVENYIIKDKNKKEYDRKLIDILASDFNRNITILRRLLELVSQKISTIFFAASVQHGKLISDLLEFKNVYVSQVYGNMNDGEKNQQINNFKSGISPILVNYDVLTTGFDSTNIRCVFIARPTKSIVLYSQMIGRGLRGRLMGGNDMCLLIDIKDNLERFEDEAQAFKYFDSYWR